ncbi:MAG: CHASE3 domain-containing protein [Gemmatimonadaceae bacterium]|nr:CHASE3 domain-containing protein [Gemmatimonadaceae bacterium]
MESARAVRSQMLIFALPLALLLLLAVVSYRGVATSSVRESWVNHTHEVLGRLASLRYEMEGVESGARGFALAGDERFLVPYDSGQLSAKADLAAILTLTKDNEAQQLRGERLAIIVDRELRLERRVVRTRRDDGLLDAATYVTEGGGLRTMIELRALVQEMSDEETRLLAIRKVSSRAAIERVTWLLGAGVFVAVLFLAFSARMVFDRSRLQSELRHTEAEHVRDAAHAKDVAVIVQELEALGYSVSHDLRAPLKHINGNVQLLQREMEGTLSATSTRYLKTIADASIEMGDLIDDLLAFSQVGRAELKEREMPLDDIVQGALRELEPSMRRRSIVWNISPLPTVIGDPALLNQLFINLLDNAIKYSANRETATITIGMVGEDENRAVLYVRDDGIGFDMKHVHKLFGVFERLHNNEAFEGTGFGLATVRRIVTRHGGTVWAEGAPNAGATFYFTLELAPRPALVGVA